jgi:hypothetical protein
MFADLAVEGGAFADEIAALADEQLQGGPGGVAGRLPESAAGDRGAVNRCQVGVIGFVAGIDRLAILLGNKRMEDARLETGGGEGALDEAMIAAGAFDGDEAVEEVVLCEGLTHLADGGVKSGPRVFDGGGRDQNAAIKIGEQHLGANLGAVEAENAKGIGSDLLDAGVKQAARLGDMVVKAPRCRTIASTKGGHENSLRDKGWGLSHSRSGQSGRSSFSLKPTYQGMHLIVGE